jgi:hypothetical protein
MHYQPKPAKLNLWHGCHEIIKKSSKIVPLGAPLSPPMCSARDDCFTEVLLRGVRRLQIQRADW